MRITTTTLTRASAAAVVLAGLIYIVIQFVHPVEVVASLTTPMWAIVHVFSFAMAVLGLIGITGVYLRQVPKFGVVGLIGYLMFGLFFLLQASFTFSEALVAPLIADADPAFAEDFVALFSQHVVTTDLGALAALPLVGAALYVLGALLFGIAIIRARVLSRGAGILLIVAAAITPIAGALLPHSLERMAAIPMGLALIWLGISLWSDQRTSAASVALVMDATA
jgi:hypothetical protein